MIELVLTLNVIVFVVLVGMLYMRGYINFYSGLFVYLAFHFITFVQRPIAVYLFDLRSEFIFMQFMPTEDIFIKTIVIANVGLFSFVLGYLFTMRFQPISPTFAVPALDSVDRRSMTTAFLLLSPLILYSFYLVLTVRLYYGVEALGEVKEISMHIDPVTGQMLFEDTSAYVVFARNMALPFASYFIILKGGRWWSFLPLGFCALMAVQTGGRWELVVSVFVAIGLMLYLGQRLLPRAAHCLMILPIAIVFIGLGQNRGLVGEFLTTGQLDLKFDLASSSFGEHPDFANFEFLTYVVGKVPDVSRTWSYFTQYLGLFTQPIPRVLWPDKPVTSPIMWVNLQAYGRFATRTTSLVGDGWISLGYIGVVMTLTAVGALYGALYKRFCRPSISIYFFCGYFWMLALLIQWSRDGGTKIFDFFFFCVTPLILAMWLRRFFSRQPARAHLKALIGDRTDSAARP